MSRGLLSVLPVFVLMAVAAAAIPNGPAYTNAKYRFTFVPPAGWVAKDHPDAIAIFMEPTGDHGSAPIGSETNKEFVARLNRKLKSPAAEATTFRANITITAAKVLSGTTVNQYARETRDRLSGLKTYRVLGEKPAKIGGASGSVRATRVLLADGGSVCTREALCIQGDTALSFSLASSPGAYKRNAAEFDKAISTLKWTK